MLYPKNILDVSDPKIVKQVTENILADLLVVYRDHPEVILALSSITEEQRLQHSISFVSVGTAMLEQEHIDGDSQLSEFRKTRALELIHMMRLKMVFEETWSDDPQIQRLLSGIYNQTGVDILSV